VKKNFVFGVIGVFAFSAAAFAAEEYPSFDFGAETRTRFAYNDNYDWNNANLDERFPWQSRIRLDFNWKPKIGQRLVVQPQFSYWDRWHGDLPLQGDQFVLYQAYYEIRDPKKWSWEWRIGRQELDVEDGSLVGASYWDNLGQTFDGIRFRQRSNEFEFDVFAARQGEWRGTGSEERFIAGIAAATHPYSPHKLFGHVLYKADRRDFAVSLNPLSLAKSYVPAKELDQYTIGGGYHYKPKNGVDAKIGGDYQFGDSAGADIDAYRCFVEVSNMAREPAPIRIGARYEFASGDPDSTDNDVQGFSPPFADYYGKHGNSFILGPPNLNDLALFADFKPRTDLTIQPAVHFFWADTVRGSVHDARGGASIPANDERQGSRDLGVEFDLDFKYRASDKLVVNFGWYRFAPGAMIRDYTGFGNHADMVFVQLTYNFV